MFFTEQYYFYEAAFPTNGAIAPNILLFQQITYFRGNIIEFLIGQLY